MPEAPRIVVVNSTHIISLALIDKLDLLEHLYGQVFIPPAVQTEVLADGPSGIGIVHSAPIAQIEKGRGIPNLLTV
jgi:predicted nucleic acid-binding protein